jgi:glucosamine--fructose-6-phosphate aminotransferase (isomerizing)
VHADQPGVVVGARRNSPLVVGLGEGENFLGSDVAAFIGYTRHALELGQDQIVTITPDGYSVIGFDGEPAEGKHYEVTWDAAAAEKGGYATFMEKEINEQPHAVADTLLGRTDESGALVLDELRISEQQLRAVDKITVVACGTAAYAGMVAKYAIEHWARIPVEVALAHEFRYADPVVNERTLVVSISQSGETMDTLMAVKHARDMGALTVSICNTHGSTIPRESDAVLYTHAGPEIAVASTKAFLAQITAAYILGLYLAQLRGGSYAESAQAVMRDLHEIPAKIEELLTRMDRVDRDGQLHGRHAGRCSSSGAMSASRSRWKARSSSRSSPISTPRASRPVSSSTARSRSSTPASRSSSSCPPRTPRTSCTRRSSPTSRRFAPAGRARSSSPHDGDEDVVPFASEVIRIPQCPPLLAPLLASRALAGLRLHLSTAKGLDVDQPRNLAKSSRSSERGVIVGVGIDVVDVARFGETLDAHTAIA